MDIQYLILYFLGALTTASLLAIWPVAACLFKHGRPSRGSLFWGGLTAGVDVGVFGCLAGILLMIVIGGDP